MTEKSEREKKERKKEGCGGLTVSLVTSSQKRCHWREAKLLLAGAQEPDEDVCAFSSEMTRQNNMGT